MKKDREQTMKANRRLLFNLIVCIMALTLVFSAYTPVAASVFDWRDISGGNYTTSVKSQGFCGSCWAFAAVGALEAKFDITYNNPGLNLDLSEQHLVCDGTCGDCNGGYSHKALDFLRNTGIVSEAELPYTASNSSPNWPLEPGWMDRVYKITANQNWISTTTDNLKSSLQTYGPLVAAMDAYNDWYWPAGSLLRGISTPPPGVKLMDDVEGINHAVVVVGYHDDPSISEGGYWIVRNSWGTWWGDSGHGYILYGDLESHHRVHAITGDAYMVPEPSTLMLLLIGTGGILLRRRQRKEKI